MGTKGELARKLFVDGFNCSQAVLAPFCEEYDLDTDIALKMACGLGMGCRSGELCGAVSGAVLVVGLKYGNDIESDSGAKANCYARTSQFIGKFKNEHGSIVCRELLGYDKSDADGQEAIMNITRPGSICADLVESAAQILEELEY
jgi:C_GCAxxG_C_C family probable redox protein